MQGANGSEIKSVDLSTACSLFLINVLFYFRTQITKPFLLRIQNSIEFFNILFFNDFTAISLGFLNINF